MKTEGNAINSSKDTNQIPATQSVFKVFTMIFTSILLFCIPGILRFRAYCESNGYHVVSISSLLWIACGFFTIFGTRYGYYYLMSKQMAKLVKKKYDDEERVRRTKMLLKLSYDTIYYVCTTVFSYSTFRKQYWFPSVVGGQGSCTQIYLEYPDWPAQKRVQLQTYFCFQFGVHAFLLFQLHFFRKNTERRYYEWLLHHIVAVSLILFSMMCNQVILGVMILIIHDASDIFLDVARFYFQAVLPYKLFIIQAYLIVQLILTWIYIRLIVYPICLLSNSYISQPMDLWPMLKYEKLYLYVLTFLLVGMHVYWVIFMFRSSYAFAQNKEEVNKFDTQEKNQ